MINYDSVTKRNINKHNLNWPQTPDHPYRILIIGSFRSGKTTALLNMIKQQHDDDYSIIHKIYLHVKDSYQTKCQYLIKNVTIMVIKV